MLTFEPIKCYNRLMNYNWQQSDWPEFTYNLQEIEDLILTFAEETGHIGGVLQSLPEDVQVEAFVNTMVAEAIKTSEIEGEYLSRQDVASSIRNNLGLNKNPDVIKDKKAQGIGELMVDVRNTYFEPLTAERLFDWHRMLLNQSKGINLGAWRKDLAPMQVISGPVGKEKVHFEAPPSNKVPAEMQRFLQWFNDTAPGSSHEIKKAPVRAAIAHLYFETIHPFEDGNGRIGRALAEKALSQTMGRPLMLSLSRTIESDKKSYYRALEVAQRSNEITEWIIYFVKMILDAQFETKQLIDFTLRKTKFFDRFKEQLNNRQLKVVRKMLDAGAKGFEGGMTASKYISITKTSKATATRDLQTLVEMTVLVPEGAGRSVRYILNI